MLIRLFHISNVLRAYRLANHITERLSKLERLSVVLFGRIL